MGALLQDFVHKFIWDTRKSSSNMTISGDFWNYVYGLDNFADERINEKLAHKISAVYSCINVRSRTVSSLPIGVFRERQNRRDLISDHPVYYLIAHQPNNYMTSANLFLTSMIHSDSWGNSYIYINRNGDEVPTSFQILCPWDVTPKLERGMAFYVYGGETLRARDVLHFRWFTYDGLEGVSPIRLNADTMGAARKQDRYSSMAIGKRPPGILTYEGNQTPAQRAENQKSWEQDLVAGKVPLLSGKWNYVPIILPPEAAEIIATRQLTKQDILAMYQMPPTFVQDYERATYTNAEQSDLVYAKHTITPIIRNIELECNMKLFTEREKKNHYVKFNMNGLLRGDLEARQKFYQAMVNTGVMNRNEVRGLEDLNSYPSGDEFLVQGAMVPADMLREHYEKQLLPTVPTQPKSYVNGHAVN